MAFVHLPASHLSSGKSFASPSNSRHSPVFVMPSIYTAYLSRGILRITDEADTQETACSLETPPNKIKMFFMELTSYVAPPRTAKTHILIHIQINYIIYPAFSQSQIHKNVMTNRKNCDTMN